MAIYTRIFKSPEHLKNKIDEYVEYCYNEGKSIRCLGFAVYMGCSANSISNYGKEGREEYHEEYNRFLTICANDAFEGMLTGKRPPVACIFTLKVNHGYEDRQIVENDGGVNLNITRNIVSKDIKNDE